jgi:hypothetical protein
VRVAAVGWLSAAARVEAGSVERKRMIARCERRGVRLEAVVVVQIQVRLDEVVSCERPL